MTYDVHNNILIAEVLSHNFNMRDYFLCHVLEILWLHTVKLDT